MLLIHPTIQLSAVLLAFYVLYLGMRRFRFLHLDKKTLFPWKRHVVLGLISLIALLSGTFIGLGMVYTHWGGFLITGTHGKVAVAMVPFILFGIFSGLYMNVRKKKRKTLPLMHGINNLIILSLGVSQAFTGWTILSTFVFGL